MSEKPERRWWETANEMWQELDSNMDWGVGCSLSGWVDSCDSCPAQGTCTKE